MARASAPKVGQGVCQSVGCGAAVWYRKSAGGLLSHKCDACDSSGFAEPGGVAFAARMATIKNPTTKPEPDPEPAPNKTPSKAKADPEPTPAKPASIFNMGL